MPGSTTLYGHPDTLSRLVSSLTTKVFGPHTNHSSFLLCSQIIHQQKLASKKPVTRKSSMYLKFCDSQVLRQLIFVTPYSQKCKSSSYSPLCLPPSPSLPRLMPLPLSPPAVFPMAATGPAPRRSALERALQVMMRGTAIPAATALRAA